MDLIRVGIVGLGNMGSAHALCIGSGKVPGMRLTAVCDTDPARLTVPDTAHFTDAEEMLSSGLIDAVIVAVPHRLHAAIAVSGFEHGLHVLTEKPEDVSVSAAKRLNEAAARSGRVFGIMFNQRTDPLFRRAREIMRSGELGALKRTVWIVTNWYRTQHYYDSGDWRATWAGEGGGVLLNQAPHNLDLWQWICGMPETVTGFCETAKYHHIEVEDDAMLRTRYANGATGVFLTSTGEYPGTNRLEISAERGKMVLENGALRLWKLERPEPEVRFGSDESFVEIPMEQTEYRTENAAEGHAGILRNFADAILHGAELIAPGEDGIRELTLSNAAYLSEWQGNRPVDLPFDAELFDRLLAERAEKSAYRPKKTERGSIGGYSDRWQVRW